MPATLALILATFCTGLSAQPDRIDGAGGPSNVIAHAPPASVELRPDDSLHVWVFFTDKGVTDAADLERRINARAAELPQRTLRRRALRGLNARLVDDRDLAVSRRYIDGVTATGATLRRESRWLNAISVETTGENLRSIAQLPGVRSIQPVARALPRDTMIETVGPIAGAAPRGGDAAWYAASYDQLEQIGAVAAHNAGYTGAGVIVGILDTGFNRTHDAFNQTTNGAHPVQVIAEHDFVADDGDTTQQPSDPANQSSHGTYILGTMAAYFPMTCVGGAFDASFVLAKTEDTSQEVPAEEDDYVAALEWIESLGADMATSSLSYTDWYTSADYDGATAVTTVGVNVAISHGLVCCTAAGNSGHDADPLTARIGAPADAPLVITCGAVNAAGEITNFSSDGPSADSRVKPEALARGFETQTTSFSTDTTIVGVNGTSLSTPLVASGVALILQAHPDWNADRIRRALFHTANIFEATSTYDPLFVQGYGIINVLAAIQFVHSDINADGVADGRDIQPFADALLSQNPDPDETRRADVNASGAVDLTDLAIFVSDLLQS
ncbi:MAG TPA: S8 family serine peptidase [Phycisphaerae bacterium]|nr:S8 family serine peptidase [Phycisphaerae bacterium]HRW54847.1 S8 family serine peptidase [Phycisphaerae bacterium]